MFATQVSTSAARSERLVSKHGYQVEGSAACTSSRSHPQVRFGYRCASAPVRHLFVQVIDDVKGVTLASASTMEAELRAADLDKTAKAKRVGELVAERAKAAGVEAVVFDRGGNKYHGRVAAVADGAREGGLAL